MAGLDTLISLLGLPIASGVNLYATVLVLGLGQRFGWLHGLPDELHILANPIVLGLAGLLYTIEFFADKIPYLDTLWDGLHTFIRPVGAAYLALQSAAAYGPEAKLLAVVVGAALGLGSHATKAGTRLLVNTSPEPFSNSIVSAAEDFGVVALLALMYSYPWIALGVVLVLIALMAVITPLLFRMIRFLVAGIAGVFAGSFGTHDKPLSLFPDWLVAKLPADENVANQRVYPCYARRVPGAPSFQPGYLVVGPGGLHFGFRKLFRSGVVRLAESSDAACSFERRVVFDVIAVDSGRDGALLCVAKNWSAAVQAEIGTGAASGEWLTAQNR
jgi:Domain of unknown function (DUF4126)